jgi:hypothetical protein
VQPNARQGFHAGSPSFKALLAPAKVVGVKGDISTLGGYGIVKKACPNSTQYELVRLFENGVRYRSLRYGSFLGWLQTGGAMPDSYRTSRKSIFLAIAILSALPLVAQKARETNRPKYDVNTETKMKGTVEEVKLPPKGSEKEIAHLLVKTGTDTVDVYLCPQSFLDDMGVSFSKGDEIALTGSRIKQGEADLILAREVVKGADTLVLRDAKGNPVWS